MLNDVERKEIDQKIEAAETRKQACVEALTIVQNHRGWVSDESLEDVAAYLEMSPSELDAIASFYNLVFRKPVGRHVIYLCDSISCFVMGKDSVAASIQEKLGIKPGQTTGDGEFTLLPAECLGACDHAPVMVVDETLYRDLDPQRACEILDDIKGAG